MKDIFDTSDTDYRVEKILTLIEEYNNKFKVKEIRTFYLRRFPDEELDANSASSFVHYLWRTEQIKKIKRGVYAPLNYSE